MPRETTTTVSTHHRTLTDGDDDPGVRLVRTIAELRDADVAELPMLYSRIDEMVEQLFGSPPQTEAQIELTFSYAGYRITVYQDGHAVIRRLEGVSE